MTHVATEVTEYFYAFKILNRLEKVPLISKRFHIKEHPIMRWITGITLKSPNGLKRKRSSRKVEADCGWLSEPQEL